MAARKKAPVEEEIIDLTELIEKGGEDSPKASSGQAAKSDADLEAILAQMDSGDGQAAKVVDPHEKLDMSDMGDIDDLLESLDIPPQPQAPAAPPAPAGAAAAADMHENLDSAVDELLGGKAAPPTQDNFAADLDAMLDGGGGAPSQDMDLDALLGQTAPAGAKKESAASPDLDADLDDLLNSIAEPDFGSPAKSSPAPQTPAPAQKKPTEAKKPAQQAPAAPAPADVSSADSGFESDLDDLLSSLDAPEKDLPKPAAPPAQPAERKAPAAQPGVFPGKPMPRNADEIFLEQNATIAENPVPPQIQGFSGKTPVAPASPEQDARTRESLEKLERKTGELEDRLQERASALNEKLQVETATLKAHLEDMLRRFGELEDDLKETERALTEARTRLAQLEKAQENQTRLEDVLREGSPFYKVFQAMLENSVGRAIAESPAFRQLEESLESKLEQVEVSGKSSSARMDSLEERLDDLEPRFNKEVGKAAAAAVGKILREEISRLVADQNGDHADSADPEEQA